MKNVYLKNLIFLELLYKIKEKIPLDCLIDEIDVDSYFFHNFLDVCVVANRVLRLSKCLFRETCSIKEFTFDPYIAYQSFKLTAELHLTKKEFFFILEKLKFIKKPYDKVSQIFFFLTDTQICKNSPAMLFILRFFTNFHFQNPKPGLESDFERFALKNSSTMSYSLIFTSKSKKLEYLLKNQQFLID